MADTGLMGNGNPLFVMMQHQVEAARTTETEMLDGFDGVMHRWCERRQRTIQAYSVFSREVLEARSPHEMMQAWVQLSKGVVERLSEDARDQMSLSQTLVKCCAGSTATRVWEEAAGNGSRMAARASQAFDSAAASAGAETRH